MSILLELLNMKGMGKTSLPGPQGGKPGHAKYNRTGKPNGRPNEFKIKPRPKKNLWFKDDRLWMRDLDHTHANNYKLKSVENEEVVACNDDETQVFGKWFTKKNRGITFHNPRPIHTAVHPNKTMKDFETK